MANPRLNVKPDIRIGNAKVVGVRTNAGSGVCRFKLPGVKGQREGLAQARSAAVGLLERISPSS